MIHYDLQCAGGHSFDGWFPGSDAFDVQCAAGQVECPRCGSAAVSRAMMAPAVSRRKVGARVAAAMPVPATAAADKAPVTAPAELVSALQRVRELVEQTCDYVGAEFAEQAGRMHRGEIQTRGIYGETSDAQAESLHEDGVAITRMPWVPRAN